MAKPSKVDFFIGGWEIGCPRLWQITINDPNTMKIDINEQIKCQYYFDTN